MLPATARLHTADEFSAVMRGGRRGSAARLVVHLSVGGPHSAARAGFVVSGKVGNSVVRHRITRRLRPLVRRELGALPAGTDLVVRALPAAAAASSAELDRDLRTGLAIAARKAGLAGWGSESNRSGAPGSRAVGPSVVALPVLIATPLILIATPLVQIASPSTERA